jgi:hypothetical protein
MKNMSLEICVVPLPVLRLIYFLCEREEEFQSLRFVELHQQLVLHTCNPKLLVTTRPIHRRKSRYAYG